MKNWRIRGGRKSGRRGLRGQIEESGLRTHKTPGTMHHSFYVFFFYWRHFNSAGKTAENAKWGKESHCEKERRRGRVFTFFRRKLCLISEPRLFHAISFTLNRRHIEKSTIVLKTSSQLYFNKYVRNPVLEISWRHN